MIFSTREDTDKLFRLLAFYRPNDPHLLRTTLCGLCGR